ncbi:TetR/AcrR family transcriptional regulator [Microbacterium oleivorans]|uniref:TetR/AcrR family transcriptional regulator C-terminal domain-containing protein n=1 Tax=Microbacterium oleivorans TaxID=273677 RepID=UPI0010A3D0A3|nr:TetR/AcrR family transcriptional regulator C-terminal domain-containing protein [Microbacterium oleivorans]THE07382.1 TetR/AcrR family transcriptional regulator [Microbacterium oleivorans]
MVSTTRSVGRPRVSVLSRRLIAETALRLLDEGEDAGFRMTDLARALGVRVSSLYNHVSGKSAVYAEIREILSERIGEDAAPSPHWDVALRDWARAYRAAFAAHPSTVAVLAVLPVGESSMVSVAYNDLVTQLVSAGWTPAESMNIIVAVESFILGSALDSSAPQDMLDPGGRTDVPVFAAAYEARRETAARDGVAPADLAFTLGLDALLVGLRSQLAARPV